MWPPIAVIKTTEGQCSSPSTTAQGRGLPQKSSLSGELYRANWNRVVDAVRTIYTGPLTYNANWDEFQFVSFWNRLDFIGIDAFFPLSDSQNPTLEELIAGWSNYRGQNWVMQIEALQAGINKPVLFTEWVYESGFLWAAAIRSRRWGQFQCSVSGPGL
jgi:hypothetical protein